MQLELYQVDAFASRVFEGNPAAVCPLQEWLPDSMMQAIALENNLAETAFFVPQPDDFQIRWFTPLTEVNLCGHATLASAHVLFNELAYSGDQLRFNSNSGLLTVSREQSLLVLDFPAQKAESCAAPDGLYQALGVDPEQAVEACMFNEDFVVVLKDEQVLRSLDPDFSRLKRVNARGVIVTSTARDYDFVNRFFAPQVGIDEDPVTGSAFTKLIPYWAEKLGMIEMRAKQVSARGGEVRCTSNGNRVNIAGHAISYLKGQISI